MDIEGLSAGNIDHRTPVQLIELFRMRHDKEPLPEVPYLFLILGINLWALAMLVLLHRSARFRAPVALSRLPLTKRLSQPVETTLIVH